MFIYSHIILTPFFLVIKVWTKCKLLIIRQSTSRFLSSARYIVDIQIYTIYSVHTGQSAFALNLLFSTSYLTLLLHSKSFIMNTFWVWWEPGLTLVQNSVKTRCTLLSKSTLPYIIMILSCSEGEPNKGFTLRSKYTSRCLYSFIH